MKRIIRLTESDLTRIIRRIIKEGGDYDCSYSLSGEPILNKETNILTFDVVKKCIYNSGNKPPFSETYTDGNIDCETGSLIKDPKNTIEKGGAYNMMSHGLYKKIFSYCKTE